MNIFSIIAGDWSQDGHNIAQTYYIGSYYSVETIKEGIENLKEKFPGIYDLCSEYEDHKVPKEFVKSLGEYVYKYKKDEFFEEYDEENFNFVDGAESYVELIVLLYNMNNVSKIIHVPEPPCILKNIGYGLFS